MERESGRVTETKERLKNAFFDLYAEKKIEKISIKEITERAQLNRGTFYVYYKDIYDLLEKAEDELIAEIMEKIVPVIVLILRDDEIAAFLPPLEFYQKNGKRLKSLFGPKGDPNFAHKLKKLIKSRLRELLQAESIPEPLHVDYIMEYITSAQLGIISYWMIEKDMDLSVPELGAMIKEITLHGPVGYLRK